MTKIVERMVTMETKIEAIGKQLDRHCTEQREDFQTIFDKLDSMENKFAYKWVERASIGIAISVMGSIIFLILQVIN